MLFRLRRFMDHIQPSNHTLSLSLNLYSSLFIATVLFIWWRHSRSRPTRTPSISYLSNFCWTSKSNKAVDAKCGWYGNRGEDACDIPDFPDLPYYNDLAADTTLAVCEIAEQEDMDRTLCKAKMSSSAYNGVTCNWYDEFCLDFLPAVTPS